MVGKVLCRTWGNHSRHFPSHLHTLGWNFVTIKYCTMGFLLSLNITVSSGRKYGRHMHSGFPSPFSASDADVTALAASSQLRCCLLGRHWSTVAAAFSSTAQAPPQPWGAECETQKVLVPVSCLCFPLRWVTELAPGNPGILRSPTQDLAFSDRRVLVVDYFLPTIYHKHKMCFPLGFSINEFQKGLSHLSLPSSLPPPFSWLNFCSLAERHYLET